MIALQITDLKTFTGRLLGADAFDHFLLEEADITTYNSFHIDGRIVKAFYTAEEIETQPEKNWEFSSWQDVRPVCFQLIKGRKTPVSFQFTLHLDEAHAHTLVQSDDCTVPAEALKAFVLNIKYDIGHVTCITATSLNTFLMDKSADAVWDNYMKSFLTSLQISFEEV